MKILACLVLLAAATCQAATLEYDGVACFSPDGAMLATSGNKCTVILWDTSTGKEIGRFYEPSKAAYVRRDVWPRQQPGFEPICEVSALSFSPDGRLLAIQRSGEPIMVWDVKNGRKVAALGGVSRCGQNICVSTLFSPDSRYLVALGRGGQKLFSIARITVWEIATHRELLYVHAGQNEEYSRVTLSPDGRTLVAFQPFTSYPPYKIRLWDIERGRELATLNGYSAIFSPNGRLLYVSDWSGVGQHIWDISSGKMLLLKEHDKGVPSNSK